MSVLLCLLTAAFVLILALKRGSDTGLAFRMGKILVYENFSLTKLLYTDSLAAGLRPALMGPSAQKTPTLQNNQSD